MCNVCQPTSPEGPLNGLHTQCLICNEVGVLVSLAGFFSGGGGGGG